MKLRSLAQTCNALPSQWEGKLDDGRFVYIRYRHGILAAGAGPTPDDALYGTFVEGYRGGGEQLYRAPFGGPLDGTMETEQMLRLTGLEREVEGS